MQIYAVLFLLILLVVPDLYIALWMIDGASLYLKILHWVPLALIVLTAVAAMTGFTGISRQVLLTAMIALIVFTCIPKLLFMLLSLIGKLLGLLWSPSAAIFNWAGLAVAAVVVCTSFYGFVFGWRKLVVHEKVVELAGLPEAFDGYRMVQLSDFHIGTYEMFPEGVDRIVETVNGLAPDVIVFTGDLVNSHPDETGMFTDALSKLKAPDGVFSIMGNHDYLEYHPFKSQTERANAIVELQNIERRAGWDLLLNENRIIHRGADSLAIVGVENDAKPPFPELGDLPKAMTGLPDGIFKILLSHDPTHWRRKVLPNTDIQLTLSGHTHAAQIQIGKWSPSSFLYPEWGGFYSEGDRVLHVSVGNGSNVAFRIGAWPEIVVLTLKRK